MKAPETPFYTVEQMAKMLGEKESTVMRKLRKGILKGKRIGRTWIISVQKFEEQISAEDEQPSKPRRVSSATKRRMRFQARKRSLGKLRERIGQVDQDIADIIEGLPKKPGPEHGPALQLLKNKYEQKKEMTNAQNTKDKKIETMSTNAYWEVAELFGRNREEIIAILETGIGETAPPQDEILAKDSEETAPPLSETLDQYLEDDARRQQEAQTGGTPEDQQQPQQRPKTKSVCGTEDRQPPEPETSPTDDDGTED